MKERQLEGFSPEISLLHMNCEGCEWEMLETLLKEADVIKKVPWAWILPVTVYLLCSFTGCKLQVRCLQVGTHYFPKVKLWKSIFYLFHFSGWSTRINVLSISFQWVVNQNERYCAIRDQLSLTHRLVWGVPYAWERWDRIEWDDSF